MKKGTMEWLEFAKRDLEAARILHNSIHLANVVLFHSQQCIEKCLKAYLEEKAIKIPNTIKDIMAHIKCIRNSGCELFRQPAWGSRQNNA
jgi:HEPN domain-containing protein